MLLLQLSEGTAAQRRLPVYLVDATDGFTPETGVAFAAGEIKVSKNGGAEANHAGTVTELAGGLYYYEATAGELDTVGFVTFRFIDAATRAFIATAQVVPWDPYDAVRLGATALPNANAEAAGGLYTRGTGAGQINQNANGQVDSRTVAMSAGVIDATAIATGAIDADAIADNAIDAGAIASNAITSAKIATGAITNATFAAGAIDAAAIADNAIDAGAIAANAITDTKIASGAITAAKFATDAITATVIAADAIGTSELSTAAANKIRDTILSDATTFAGANINATISSRASATQATDIETDTQDIQSRLPATLDGGLMRSQVKGMDAGTVTAAAVATGAIDADALASDAVTEIRSLASGTSDSGSTTTMVDAARTEADTDYWKGKLILFTSGNIAGQARLITGFDAATDTITFAPATTQAVLTQTYEILPHAAADLRLWLGTAPNALTSGRVDALVGAMGADTITAAVIADNAIDAGAIAAGAIGSSEAPLLANLDATVSSRATQAQILSDATPFPGARIDAAISSRSVAGDQMALVASAITTAKFAAGAIDSNALATSAADEIRDAILTDATRFAGGNINATISSRATQTTADAIEADTQDIQSRLPGTLTGGRMRSHVEAMSAGVVDATVVADGTIDAATFASGAINATAIATDAFGALELAAGAATEIADAVEVVLSGVHGAGSWEGSGGGGGTDWTTGEKAQIRHRLGIDGSASAPSATPSLAAAAALAAVQVDTTAILARLPASLTAGGRIKAEAETIAAGAVASVADGVWDEARAGHVSAGTFGEGVLLTSGAQASAAAATATATWDRDLDAYTVGQRDLAGGALKFVRQLHSNRQEADFGAGLLRLFADDGSTALGTWPLTDAAGDPIVALAGAPARRGTFT